MPRGVEVEVDKGFALITFTDPKVKSPMLHRLIAGGAPINVDTSGRRRRYRVPAGNAVAAGVIDVPKTAAPPHAPKSKPPVSAAGREPQQQSPLKRRPGRPRKSSLGGG